MCAFCAGMPVTGRTCLQKTHRIELAKSDLSAKSVGFVTYQHLTGPKYPKPFLQPEILSSVDAVKRICFASLHTHMDYPTQSWLLSHANKSLQVHMQLITCAMWQLPYSRCCLPHSIQTACVRAHARFSTATLHGGLQPQVLPPGLN